MPDCGNLPFRLQGKKSFKGGEVETKPHLARIIHELLSRDQEDGRATWQPQGVGSEAYLKMLQRAHSP